MNERLVHVWVSFFVVLLSAGPAFGQDVDRSRDDDIFGAPSGEAAVENPVTGATAAVTEPAVGPPATAQSSTPSERAEDAIFGTEDTGAAGIRDISELPSMVAEDDDNLDVGGLAYFRGNYSYSRDAAALEAPLRTPTLFDLYTDGRPSDRVRVFARGRLRYDFSIPATAEGATDGFGREVSRSDAALDQLWVKFDVDRTLFVTAGKQPLKWGSGRFWNPTDFLNPVVRDPLAVFDERLGISLLKLHLPFEAAGMNFYAVADVEGADSPDDVGAALRAEVLLGTAELALSGAIRKDAPRQVGADVSAGLWDFDVHVEAAFRNHTRAPHYEGELDLVSGRFPRPVSRFDAWLPQLVAGVEYAFNYSDDDSAAIGVEYFYNEAGYEDPSLYPFLIFQQVFRPLYVGRHYAGLYALLAAPGSWNDTTFIASTLTNISDGSYLSRLDYRFSAFSYANVDAFVNYHYGSNGEFNFGFSTPGIAGAGVDAFAIAQPRVDLGVGMRVPF